MLRKKGARVLAAALAAALAVTAAPVTFGNTAKAATQQKVSLGVGKIKAPTKGKPNQEWRGSYVWFGNDNGDPVKYRVLSTDESKFGKHSLFLDCDSILSNSWFNYSSTSLTANSWRYSKLRETLNYESPLEYERDFTKLENEAVIDSYIESHFLNDTRSRCQVTEKVELMFESYVALSFDKRFLMDIEDLMNVDYGYYPGEEGNASRVKRGTAFGDDTWWIRNAFTGRTDSLGDRYKQKTSTDAGCILADGSVGHKTVREAAGVSPAINIDVEHILLSTAVSGNTGETGTEYTLTLYDPDIQIQADDDGAKIRKREVEVTFDVSNGLYSFNGPIPYIMILDGEFSFSNGSDANVLYFAELDPERISKKVIRGKSKAFFQLPSNLNINDWGEKYHVYLVAQTRESDHMTAYGDISDEIRSVKVIPHVTDVFKDVKASDWFVKAVQYVYENNIMKGKGDKFGPNDGIQREEVVQVLYNYKNKPAVNISNPFPDVKSNAYYYKAVLWAKQIGIVDGYGNGKFGVGDKITREQLAVMLYNFAYEFDYPTIITSQNLYKEYKDSKKVSSWARTAMDWALAKGIMSGKGAQGAPASQKNLDPQGTATRAECASMMMKLLELEN